MASSTGHESGKPVLKDNLNSAPVLCLHGAALQELTRDGSWASRSIDLWENQIDLKKQLLF